MFRLSIIAFLILLLAACASPVSRKRGQDLTTAIDRYAAALRWSRIDEARDYHVDREGVGLEQDLSFMDSIRVTGHKIRERIIDRDISEATVTGEFSYYNEDYGTLKTIPFTQQWWYQEDVKKWFIESPFPEFK